MPNIYLPYINIAIDSFALVVMLIVFASCFPEFSNKRRGSKSFFVLLSSVTGALVADILASICEGRPEGCDPLPEYSW